MLSAKCYQHFKKVMQDTNKNIFKLSTQRENQFKQYARIIY